MAVSSSRSSSAAGRWVERLPLLLFGAFLLGGCNDAAGIDKSSGSGGDAGSGGSVSTGGLPGSGGGGEASGGSGAGGLGGGGVGTGGQLTGGSSSGGSTGGLGTGGGAECGQEPCLASLVEEFEHRSYDAVRSHVSFLTSVAPYDRSDDSLSTPYDEWSEDPSQIPNKPALRAALEEAWTWIRSVDRSENFLGQRHTIMTERGGVEEASAEPNDKPRYYLPLEDGFDVYVAWVAHAVALDRTGLLPWTLADLASQDGSLARNLLGASSMMTRRDVPGLELRFHTSYHGNFLGLPFSEYLGDSLPGMPRYTFTFLEESGLIKSTRRETIEALLDWAGQLVHFYGAATREVALEHWGHPYPPTVEQMVEGTVRDGESLASHWTLGCHGTTGFLKAVLRAANIPVQIPAICGHAMAAFPSEGLFLDHGDNPYNSTFSESGCSAAHLLIDEQTFLSRVVYETNHDDDAVCAAESSPVGRQVRADVIATCDQ